MDGHLIPSLCYEMKNQNEELTMVDPVNLMFNRKRKKDRLSTKKEENQTIHGSHSTYQYITVQCVHSQEIRLEMLVDFVSTKIFQNFCCSSSYSKRITSL